MDRYLEMRNSSLLICAIPGAAIALTATFAALFGWGGLSFDNTTYSLILVAAA